jgi:signal transduction histidine kinase
LISGFPLIKSVQFEPFPVNPVRVAPGLFDVPDFRKFSFELKSSIYKPCTFAMQSGIIPLHRTMDGKIRMEQFVASLSKELKEPVIAIQGLVRIAEYYPQDDEIRKCLRLIGDCALSMEHIMHQVSEFIGIEHYQPQVTNLRAAELKQLLTVEFAKSGSAHQLRLHLDIELDEVTGDINSMVKIFKYILGIALSYPSDDLRIRTISVQLRQHEEHLEMIIGDKTGEEVGAGAFDVFAKNTSDEAGMGLFMANSLARRIGATISLMASSSKGTSIILQFPNELVEA